MTVIEQDAEELEEFSQFWLQHVDAVGFGVYHDVLADGIESPYNPHFSCAQPFQRMFIMWDGVCIPCCVDDQRSYITGDATNTRLHDIWHGHAYQSLREAQLVGVYKKINICKRCYVPYTELDGQVVSAEDVVSEVRRGSEKQRTRWYNHSDLELPKRALRRKAESEAKGETR
jgi:hypothetical protein